MDTSCSGTDQNCIQATSGCLATYCWNCGWANWRTPSPPMTCLDCCQSGGPPPCTPGVCTCELPTCAKVNNGDTNYTTDETGDIILCKGNSALVLKITM